MGDPGAPPDANADGVGLHRCCQELSSGEPGAVYEDEEPKVAAYTRSVPPALFHRILPRVLAGRRVLILAEDWQTAGATQALDALLRRAGLREWVTILWNANNTFGFDRIDLPGLARAASITAVSRYMRQLVEEWGVAAAVLPNGIDPDGLVFPGAAEVSGLRARIGNRWVLAKMARWDPTKAWNAAVQVVAEAKRQGRRPLLIARGGTEEYGAEVHRAMREARLEVRDVRPTNGEGLAGSLEDTAGVDVLNVETHVAPIVRRLLFRVADAVLANSSHEPFGLVGLETMAIGGVAVTGCTGEDYAAGGHNAIVLQTEDPRELFALYDALAADPAQLTSLRRAARETAERHVWPEVLRRSVLPWVEVQAALQGGEVLRGPASPERRQPARSSFRARKIGPARAEGPDRAPGSEVRLARARSVLAGGPSSVAARASTGEEASAEATKA